MALGCELSERGASRARKQRQRHRHQPKLSGAPLLVQQHQSKRPILLLLLLLMFVCLLANLDVDQSGSLTMLLGGRLCARAHLFVCLPGSILTWHSGQLVDRPARDQFARHLTLETSKCKAKKDDQSRRKVAEKSIVLSAINM